MSKENYNIFMFLGVLMASVGAGGIYFPAGLITGGVLMITLTIYAVEVSKQTKRD